MRQSERLMSNNLEYGEIYCWVLYQHRKHQAEIIDTVYFFHLTLEMEGENKCCEWNKKARKN